MGLRYCALTLALLLGLATTSLTTAQTDQAPTLFLPLIEQHVAGAEAVTTPASAYADSAVSPAVETPAEAILPYSLRDVGTARTTAAIIDVQLPPLDVEQLRQEDHLRSREQRGRRIGVVRSLPTSVAASAAQQPSGRWQAAPDGGHYWTLTLASPEAKAIRIHLENLTIPVGGHVMVYNTNAPTERYGPYRQPDLHGASDLWTASVFGPVVTLEYYVPSTVDLTQVDTFQVSAITHQYVESAALLNPQEGTCHNDVMCSAAWTGDANSVAGLGTIGGSAGVIWCSGALLNDLDGETTAGYFLTANHCLSDANDILGTQANANTIEFYWQFQAPNCGGAVPNAATVPRTVGGADLISVQSRSAGNDHAFLRIRNPLPGGLILAGWDTTAFGNGDDIVGIHHPDGAFKRISFGDISTSNTNYWSVIWTSGVTEPGSSGSPLFDAAHRIRGQLFGGDSSCTVPKGVDDYGRFNVTYPLIRRWLEVGGTIHVNRAHPGAEEGTPTQPYRTINGANGFAWDGVRIKIKAGVYPEAVTISRNVVLVADGGAVVIGRP